MKPHLLNMTADELRQKLVELGEKRFRADQLINWVYKKGVTDGDKMSSVSPALVQRFDILTSHIAARSDSEDGCTRLLLQYPDGAQTETVLIPTSDRATACISTQSGCAMGCKFCASGLGGLNRNLTGGEILEQIVHLKQATGRTITNVVFMGMGEPLANFDATVFAVLALVDEERFGISARRVTVSTVGLPREIRRLAKLELPITLAISLHAPNDPLRQELVPVARRFPLDEILDAADAFYQSRKREVTLEYTLLANVNDSPLCADGLARLAHRLRCNVNLIRYNPVAELDFQRPSEKTVSQFAERLEKQGVNVNVRSSRGIDADSACGQLRRRRGNG